MFAIILLSYLVVQDVNPKEYSAKCQEYCFEDCLYGVMENIAKDTPDFKFSPAGVIKIWQECKKFWAGKPCQVDKNGEIVYPK
jgi:hypothetical protein